MSNQEIVVEPVAVITRHSSDILCIEDSDVAEALRFIRQNAHLPIHISDVVESVSISRRSLEAKFRNTLNRTILQEIRRVRVDLFAQMLIETNLSIPQIASELNFPSAENIGRYFELEKGMRPSVYRSQYSV